MRATRELGQFLITAAAVAVVLFVFGTMEGSDHATTSDRDSDRVDLGELVFLEPRTMADDTDDARRAALYLYGRPGDVASLARGGRLDAFASVPTSGGISSPIPERKPAAGSVGDGAAIGISRATHYGPAFEGSPMACTGEPYSGENAAIAAVAEGLVPCGARLRVCGPAGCGEAVRADTCPGCGFDLIDLSEAGHALVCGPGAGTCNVTVERID